MSTYKRITGDYSITTLSSFDNVNITTHTVTVDGNLNVLGNVNAIDFIDVTNLIVDDPVILLANGQTGSPTVDIGIIGQRGTESNIASFWDEANGEFRMGFTSSGANVTDIVLTSFAPLQVGDLQAANVTFTGNFTVVTLAVTGNLSAGNLSTPGSIDSTGNITTASNLSVASDVAVGGNIDATDTITANILIANSITTNGAAGFGNLSTGNIIITGNADINGVITANGLATVGTYGITTTGANVTVTESSGTGGWVIANNFSGGNLTLSGAANITGNLSVTANISGGNLSVLGDISGNNITAFSNVTSGNLTVYTDITNFGNLQSGNIFATATITATGNISGSNISGSGNLFIAGSSLLQGPVETLANVSVAGNLSVAQATQLSGNLTVVGNTTLESSVTIDTTLSVTGNITGGNITTAGDLAVSGNTSTSNLTVVENITTSAISATTITATGNITGGNLNTAGNITTTGGNINATGLTILGNISAGNIEGNIAGNVEAGGLDTYVQFNDATVANGTSGLTFTKASNTLYVGGNIVSDGNLTIAAETTIGANTVIQGNLQVVGNINALSFVDLDTGNLQIVLANAAATPSAANSAGVVVNGAAASILYYSIPDAWVLNKNTQTQGTGSWTGNVTAPWFLGNLSGTTAQVSGNVNTNNLAVSGTTTLSGAATATNNFTVAGQTTLGEVVTMGNALGGVFTVRNTSTGLSYIIGAGSGLATGGTNQNLVLNPNGTGTIELEATTNVTGSLGVSGTITGTGSGITAINATNITTGTLAQARLANASLTVNGVVITLGASGTVTANTPNSLTFNNTGTGAASGTTFNGSAAITISHNTIGAAPQAGNSSITTVGTISSGTWQGSVISTTYTEAKVTSVNGSTGAVSGLATTAGALSQFAATTSAQLAGVITDETGSGNLVFNTSPTFISQITTPAIAKSGTSGVGDIGSAANRFNLVYARATSAQYADLAEMYVADQDIEPGTVVVFGGTQEITTALQDHDTRVAGVISTDPAHLMNSAQQGDHVLPVALVGRVPCRVVGPVRRGDLMVSAGAGRARAESQPRAGSVIGKALADFTGTEGVIEVVVGRC